MNHNTAIMLTAVILLTACATPQHQTYGSASGTSVAVGTTTHSYELLVKDSAGQTLEGANVSFSTSVEGQPGASKTACTTDTSGTCMTHVRVAGRYLVASYTAYSSKTSYSVTKPGFYEVTGKLSSDSGTAYKNPAGENPVKDSVVLYRPADYLSKEFLNSSVDLELREQALKFISLIRLQSLIVDADIMLRSASTSVFKGKKYFQLKINTATSYNSLKLDKYSIAKTLFDDSIRKILNPLNDNISNPKTFFGYDLIIYGYTKSFAEKNVSPEKIEYRFLIPQNVVKRYKDKDISGQQLLDGSVILMNDERIDLKLQ